MIQPPTDNLYKFLAIFGLIVFGFSGYISLHQLTESNREVAKWNAAWGPITERAKQGDDNAREDLQCAIASAEAREAGKKEQPTDECAAVSAARQQARIESRNLALAMEQLRSGKAMLDYSHWQTALYVRLGIIFGAVGFAVCVCGFCLWYLRLQQYLDADARRMSGKERSNE